MKVLGISTSTKLGSISLFDSGKEILSSDWSRSSSHGEILTPELDRLLNECNWKLEDINLLAVDRGPGSFTGIRVAINSIKTLAYSLKLPVYAENSLKLLALQTEQEDVEIHCILSAFRNELYHSSFQRKDNGRVCLKEASCISTDDFMELDFTDSYLVGDGINHIELSQLKNLDPELVLRKDFPHARNLCQNFFESTEKPKTIEWKELTSLYIKASSAEEKLQKGLLKPLPKL